MNTPRNTFLIFMMLILLVAANVVMAQDSISIGDTVEGQMSNGATVEYALEATEGEVINIAMTGDFDTYLYLLDSDGTELARNDDGGDGTNSLIRGFVIPADGTFIIQAASFSSDANGSFTLSVTELDLIPVSVDKPVTQEFSAETNSFTFGLIAEVGQVVNIVVDSGNSLDTKIELISPYDFSIGENDDADGTVDPALNSVLIDTEGTYFIVVSPSNPNASLSGEFTLSVTEAELLSLDSGPVDLAFSFDTNESVITFEGTAGETVTLTITIEDEQGYGSPYFDITQNNEQFANFNMRGVETATVSLEIPDDGEVRIAVQAYSEININIALGRELE